MPYVSTLFHISRNICPALHAAVSSERCGISSTGLHLVYQHRYCHQEFSVAFCCAVAQFLFLDGSKQVHFCSLGPGLCKTSYMQSYKWFCIIQWSVRRSACSRWYSCRIFFFFQRRSHHIVRSGKYPCCRCSCPYGLLNFSVRAFTVITALSIFHSPRPLRIIGRSIDIRRHTAR